MLGFYCTKDKKCIAKRPLSLLLLFLLALPVLTSCSSISINQQHTYAVISATPPENLQQIHTPTFLIKNSQQPYNLIGTPSVRTVNQHEDIFVNSQKASIYFELQTFSTETNSYKNLIYRIHFEKVPFSLLEPNLTTGKNPAILFIYTLDKNDEIVLVTTVHSCGCYLAFFPTSSTPKDAYPIDWPSTRQSVYGYSLPNLLTLPPLGQPGSITFSLESGSHRISDVIVDQPISQQNIAAASVHQLTPMAALYQLPYGEKTVSFFETEGSRKGYTKNNLKILERLLISWWALDLRVGQDKAYGKDDKSGIPLYTSLKFWARDESDLKNFPKFLKYWGWKF